MRVPFLDLPQQHREVAPEIESALQHIISTGAFVLGQHNTGLEKEIASLHGVDFAIALNSGTDALRIMLDASGVGPGDEVITTAFTFVATIETILQAGARPVFVDVEPETFQIDVNKIEAAITSKTKAIMPVHLFGQLCDVQSIQRIADAHGLIILEDAAQAIMSHHEGVFAGNFGLCAGLSFYVTKNLGAAGDGGMILTNDEGINERARSLRVHGMGRERYYYDAIGYTSRMAEIQAAILRIKLTKLAQWTANRQKIAERYHAGLAGTDVKVPITLPGNNHTWHQYTIRSTRRDKLQAHLKQLEVDSMIYYPVPLHYHEPYKFLGFAPGSLPETERAALEVLSLPIHQHLTDEQVDFVVQSIREFSLVTA